MKGLRFFLIAAALLTALVALLLAVVAADAEDGKAACSEHVGWTHYTFFVSGRSDGSGTSYGDMFIPVGKCVQIDKGPVPPEGWAVVRNVPRENCEDLPAELGCYHVDLWRREGD